MSVIFAGLKKIGEGPENQRKKNALTFKGGKGWDTQFIDWKAL